MYSPLIVKCVNKYFKNHSHLCYTLLIDIFLFSNSEPLYVKNTEMKRKVNAGKLRLSPNEEAFILKEDYERRRKLRLLQVKFI